MVKHPAKYLSIVYAAQKLFWKHGFKRVSIEEICRKADVSKMTFYKFFPNKTELAKAIFNELVEKGEAKFRDIMQSDTSPANKIKQVILMKLESTNDISPEFLHDFYAGGEPDLQAYVEKRTNDAWLLLRQDYINAQEKGIFRKDFNIDILLKVQLKLMELLEDEQVTSLFDSRQDLIMEFANLLVYGIVSPEKDDKA